MTQRTKIVVATRPSLLAYTQTMQTVELLKEQNPDVDFEVIKFSTKGDRDQKRSLTQFGGTGLFVKELEFALMEGEADIAIHSLKDVPSDQPEGLSLIGFPKREDVRDLFLTCDGKTIDQMPEGFVCGTGSPRRRIQIHNLRNDVECKEIRGNIDTRFQKLQDGEYDAILLAAAGMNRLGKEYNQVAPMSTSDMIPAVGQGAIAIECRSNDAQTIEIVEKISDQVTKFAVLAERAFMAEIEGGCKFPLAANATVDGETLTMTAIVGDLKTNRSLIKEMTCSAVNGADEASKLAKNMKAECEVIGIDFYL